MKVAIDISPIENANKFRGTGTYTRQLIESLSNYAASNTYVYFTKQIPRDVDVVHFPFFDPFFLTLPFIKQCPVIVTIHDLIPITYSKYFPKGIRGEIKWRIQKFLAQHVNQIITDSESSSSEIRRILGVSRDRIHTIYLAPSSDIKRIIDHEILQKVRNKYAMPEKFILYVGDINWNKNIIGLLHAFSVYAQKSTNTNLVIVSNSLLEHKSAEAKNIFELIHHLKLDIRVIVIGNINIQELSAFYTMASVYVQPSIAEGFGLPVLEAMRCCCKVVCSNVTSLKEIAGPSFLCDPSNPLSIVQSMEKALDFDTQVWKFKAEDWVKRFSWKKVALETAKVYQESISR